MKPSKDIQQLPLSRRSFLVGSVGASLVMAFGNLGCASSPNAAADLANKRFSPATWFEIDGEGNVSINVARAEMGQHVGTAWARIVADELGADWNKVSIIHVDTDPKWGYMVTGGSWSVNKSFFELSRAGAAGRVVLQEAGAQLMEKPAGDCQVENGRVSCGSKSVSFGEIVSLGNIDRVFSADELAALPVKPASQYTMMGRETRALDIPAKTDGTAVFGIDVELPGMVFARPVIPPTRYGSEILSVDETKVVNIPGYLGYQQLNDPSNTLQGWIAVIAKTYPAAIKSADALIVNYKAGPTAKVSEADIQSEGERLVEDNNEGYLFVDHGDMEKASAEADTTLEATYRTASNLHFQLEPVNALAAFSDGVWHIHTGSQWQSLTMPLLALALEVPEADIIMHQYYLGGGFGRRLAGDYTIPAALTSKALGRPVKMVFTREDDTRFDCIRSPSVQHFSAAIDGGKLLGIEHAATAGWPTKAMAPGFLFESLDKKGKIDPFSSSGADHWYSLQNHRVRMITNELAQRTFLPGWLRAVGAGWIGWGVEGFFDEVAVALDEDPLDLRIRLLDGADHQAGVSPVSVGGATRLAGVLKKLKKQGNWGQTLPEGEGLGVAACAGQERTMPTWVGCIAHVKVDQDSGKIRVKKLSVQVDCGTQVHPDGALAQVESSVLWGLSLALFEGTEIADGQVADHNLDTYSPLRMADVPELDIQFVQSNEMPVGLGEPGLIVVGPAIANAIYAATGVRLRDLPIKPEDVVAQRGSRVS
ncbi:MAG: molybdopterin cofactor-binding domain-containing protein [Halioglobus sp.]